MSKKLTFFEPKIYGTVTNDKIYHLKKFHEHGLFSEQIFGPVEDFTCQCGKYMFANGGKCPECNVEYVSSEERMKRFAKIDLPVKIIWPPFIWGLRNTKSDIIFSLLNYDSILVKENDNYIVKELNEDLDIDKIFNDYYFGADAVEKLFEYHNEKEEAGNKTDIQKHKLYKLWKKFKDNFFIDYVLVLPPELRPVIKYSQSIFSDELNKKYIKLINKVNAIKGAKYVNKVEFITKINLKKIQTIVNDIYTSIFNIFTGKTGILRGNTLGKRIDFSGRSVIVPDPSLKLNQVRISYYILLEVYKFHVAREVAKTREIIFYTALKNIEEELIIKNYKFNYMTELEKVISDKVVIINRQPTLHKHSALSFNIVIGKDETISIHPLICSCYNADFDGDQMACYFSITNEATEDIKNKMLSINNLFLESSGDLAFVPSQDIIYGIYVASKKNPEVLPKQLRAYMKLKDIKFITKKHLLLFLNKYIKKTKDYTILDEIKEIGFKYATSVEIDISLESLQKANISKQDKDELVKLSKTYDLEKYYNKEKELINKMIKNCSFSQIILSGSRGSLDQLKQMFIGKGYVADSQNNIIKTPIVTSLVDGLSKEELFLSAYGVRKGLSDVADNTAKSGVFCRSLVYLAVNSRVNNSDEQDCKPTKYLKINVKDAKIAKSLVGRYLSLTEEDFLNQKYIFTTLEDVDNLIGKDVFLRSPLFCTHQNFCHKCAPSISKNIGVNAALSLGERSTQLVLRTFHTSGVVSSNRQSDDDKNKDITSDLTYVMKMFNNPSNYMKEIDDVSDFIINLFTIFSNYGIIKLLNFEVLVSNLFWVHLEEDGILEEYKLWRLQQDKKCEMIGMNKVPSLYSFLVSAAYSHFKKKILSSINKKIGDTLFDKILLGKF